jgi:hypothetical protein
MRDEESAAAPLQHSNTTLQHSRSTLEPSVCPWLPGRRDKTQTNNQTNDQASQAAVRPRKQAPVSLPPHLLADDDSIGERHRRRACRSCSPNENRVPVAAPARDTMRRTGATLRCCDPRGPINAYQLQTRTTRCNAAAAWQ